MDDCDTDRADAIRVIAGHSPGRQLASALPEPALSRSLASLTAGQQRTEPDPQWRRP